MPKRPFHVLPLLPKRSGEGKPYKELVHSGTKHLRLNLHAEQQQQTHSTTRIGSAGCAMLLTIFRNADQKAKSPSSPCERTFRCIRSSVVVLSPSPTLYCPVLDLRT